MYSLWMHLIVFALTTDECAAYHSFVLATGSTRLHLRSPPEQEPPGSVAESILVTSACSLTRLRSLGCMRLARSGYDDGNVDTLGHASFCQMNTDSILNSGTSTTWFVREP